MNVVILEDAADDIEAARSFYNSLASSLGEYFCSGDHYRSHLPPDLCRGPSFPLRIPENAFEAISVRNLL